MVQEGSSICGARQRVPNGVPYPPWLVLVSWNLHRKHHGMDIIHGGSCVSTMARKLAQFLVACNNNMPFDWADRQTARQIDSQTDGQTDRWAGRQKDIMTDRQSGIMTNRQSGMLTDRQAGRQTRRQ